MQFPTGMKTLLDTTAVVDAKGIITKMDVQGVHELNGHLHIIATPTQWGRKPTEDGHPILWQPAAPNTTAVLVPARYSLKSSGSLHFATSAVGTKVSLHFRGEPIHPTH